MSLILEALRKSEAERRRGLAPDVAMELPPTPAARPHAMTTWLLPALVVVALLVLAGWWAMRETATPTSPETVIATATDATPAETRPPPAQMPRIEPRPAAASSLPAPAPSAALPPKSAPVASATVASAAAASRPTPFQPAPMQPVPARPLPPPAGDISNDASMLPPVKLSMLMWDDVPSKRFVILNGQRMAEGDRHGELTVIAIERSGVVVEGNGSRARVPLP